MQLPRETNKTVLIPPVARRKLKRLRGCACEGYQEVLEGARLLVVGGRKCPGATAERWVGVRSGRSKSP